MAGTARVGAVCAVRGGQIREGGRQRLAGAPGARARRIGVGGAAVTVSVAAGTGGLVVAGVLLLLTGTAAASGLRRGKRNDQEE